MTHLIYSIVAAAGIMVGASSASAVTYRTICDIEGGRAIGYVQLLGDTTSTSFSGKAWFEQYDADGDLVARDWTIVVTVVVGQDLTKVEDIAADTDADSCRLDLTEIIGPPADDTDSPVSYTTFCDIKDGRAWGAMRLKGDSTSTSFSGKVYFTFFDALGREIGRDWTIAVVVVVGQDREAVDDVKAPAAAKRCALDISEAIGG